MRKKRRFVTALATLALVCALMSAITYAARVITGIASEVRAEVMRPVQIVEEGEGRYALTVDPVCYQWTQAGGCLTIRPAEGGAAAEMTLSVLTDPPASARVLAQQAQAAFDGDPGLIECDELILRESGRSAHRIRVACTGADGEKRIDARCWVNLSRGGVLLIRYRLPLCAAEGHGARFEEMIENLALNP